MSVVAWDGVTLAGDRQGSSGTLKFERTKIFRHPEKKGVLIGLVGNSDACESLHHWFVHGGDWPAKWQESDDWASMLVVSRESVLLYGRSKLPVRIEKSPFAIGCGRDFAFGAMACGVDARSAVEVACKFDSYCGMGIDVLRLDD